MRAPRRPRSPLFLIAGFSVLSIAGFGAGMLLAFPFRENAPNIVVLAAGTALSWRVARATLAVTSQPLISAVALQGGYVVWLAFGLLVLRRWLGLADIVALLAGLYWLGHRPGRPPAIYLLIVHCLAIVLLLVEATRGPDPAALLPTYLTHAALRALGVFLTLRGLNVIWRRARRPAPRLA